jgi:hypothetical protein
MCRLLIVTVSENVSSNGAAVEGAEAAQQITSISVNKQMNMVGRVFWRLISFLSITHI